MARLRTKKNKDPLKGCYFANEDISFRFRHYPVKTQGTIFIEMQFSIVSQVHIGTAPPSILGV